MLYYQKRIMLLMLVLCCILPATGYTQHYSIQLSGHIDSFYTQSYATNELMLRKVVTSNLIGKEELISVPLDKRGSFKIQLPIDDSLCYLSFAFENKQPGVHYGAIRTTHRGSAPSELKEAYLFQAGDAVHVTIKPITRPYFSGKGSERLNCASKIYDIDPIHYGLSLTDMQLKQTESESFALRQDALDYCIRMRLRLLQAYQKALSPYVYQLLRADAIYNAVYQFYRPVINEPNFELTTWRFTKNLIQDVFANTQPQLPAAMDPAIIATSAYGADLLFRNEMMKRLLEQPDLIKDRGLFASNTYHYFKNKYSGVLRDKLLLIFFETLGRHFSTEMKYLVTEALASMEAGKYSRSLQKWKDAQYYAYPFQLYDGKQRLHTLADYKGKLVIMDFYFEKCGPCIALAKTMKEIVQQYKDREDVVFITVSTDPREVFLKTLGTQVFTSDETVNLYTNDEGMAHPLIRHYDFRGFPKMLVIGKDGLLITSSPLRPELSENNRKAFIQMIEDNR